MKQNSIILLLLVISIISSCQNKEVKSINNKTLNKGHLIYDHEIYGIPLGFDFKFNEENVCINEKFGLEGEMSRTTLVNKKYKEVLHLEKNSKTKKYLPFFYTSINRMIDYQKGSTYGDTLITKTKEYKNILGYQCNKTIMNLGKQVVVILWTTDKIKTGITFPNTPLTLNETALEYEMKLGEQTMKHYKIKSIEDVSDKDKDFKPTIPDESKLLVPISVYSLRPDFQTNNFKEKLKSFEYPVFKGGIEECKKYFKSIFLKLETNERSKCRLNFTINKSGNMETLTISGGEEKSKILIQNELKKMPTWIPGKANGINVNSELNIYN